MKRISILTLVVDCIALLTSLFRICTNQAVAFDYVIVFITSILLALNIYVATKAHKKKKTSAQEEESSTGDGSPEDRRQGDGSVVP